MSNNIWVNPDGTFYCGEKVALSDHIPAATPPPGVTHALLDGDGNFLRWADPLPPPPSGTGFRTAIAQAASYQAWVDSLPQHRAISLAIAAANDNWAEAQVVYNAAVAITPPASGARAEWQAIADANYVPLNFGSD